MLLEPDLPVAVALRPANDSKHGWGDGELTAVRFMGCWRANDPLRPVTPTLPPYAARQQQTVFSPANLNTFLPRLQLTAQISI